MSVPHLLFVTGKLAEPALRRVLEDLGPQAGFRHSVAVLPITVAALTTTSWVARHLNVPADIDRVVLPGLCSGKGGPSCTLRLSLTSSPSKISTRSYTSTEAPGFPPAFRACNDIL